jgi:HEAT repeat protein
MALGALGGSIAEKALAGRLLEADPADSGLCLVLVEALAACGSLRSVPVLRGLSRDERAGGGLRRVAAEALARLGERHALGALSLSDTEGGQLSVPAAEAGVSVVKNGP